MSAPRRPGDDRRAGRRPGKTDTRADAPTRGGRATPSKDEAPAKAMSPGRKVRAEGWAKAKPPRDKPGRAHKFGGKFGGGKQADRPTPMREDGPRRFEEDRLSPRRDAPPQDGPAPRGARFNSPAGERADRAPRASAGGAGGRPAGDRPKRSFGDRARDRAAPSARHAGDEGDARRSPRAVRTEGDDGASRPDRAPRGADRHARPATTLRPAFGAPRAVRDDAARPVRDVHDRTTRPARPARDDARAQARPERPERPARATTGKVAMAKTMTGKVATTKIAAGDKQPNRAARRAELRRPIEPTPAPVTQASAATVATAPAPDVPFLPGSGIREPQRIAKLLARAGIASRREIERMIEDRRIALDGVALETPATILTSLRGVTVDGQPVQAAAAARLFLFHKPPGVLTAERDFSGRPTIYDRLPEDLPRVMPVGRLDLNTEGLLLLTNDGEFKRKLELPSTAIPRVYRARTYGDVTQAMLEDLSDGVEIEGIRYGPIDANLERRTGANVWIEMRITEGKNREIRRVLEYLGLQVSRLIRVAYGEFVLADLASGGIVEVRQNDLVAFRQNLR